MKNNNLSKYFEDEMLSANGASGYNNFVGDWANDFNNFGGDGGNYTGAGSPFQYASGGQAPQAAPTSLPYIVSVQNSTTAAIANVTIFNANVSLAATDTAFGNTAGIVITSGVTGVSYYKLLQVSKDKPFRVAQTYISSATTGQIQVQYSVVQIAPNGVRVDTPITPNIDPYQFQSTVLVNTTQYIVDGDTSIVFASLFASTTVTFQLFPVNTANVTRTLTDTGVVNQLGSPQTIRNNRIQIIGNGGMQSLQG